MSDHTDLVKRPSADRIAEIRNHTRLLYPGHEWLYEVQAERRELLDEVDALTAENTALRRERDEIGAIATGQRVGGDRLRSENAALLAALADEVVARHVVECEWEPLFSDLTGTQHRCRCSKDFPSIEAHAAHVADAIADRLAPFGGGAS